MLLFQRAARVRVLYNTRDGGVFRRDASNMKTINLAEPKVYSKERPVQKLVSFESSCPNGQSLVSRYPQTRAVPVRICRREDLERACQPKLCDCPQRPAPKSAKQILCGWMVLGAKGVLAVGLLYWTASEGIWGHASDTEDFYFRIRDTVSSNSSLGDVSLPHLEYIKFKIIDSYNRAVIAVVGTIVDVPRKLSKTIRDALYPCEPIEEEDPTKKKK